MFRPRLPGGSVRESCASIAWSASEIYPYGSHGNHLDLYRPRGSVRDGSLPLVLFIHGGGFRYFSKGSHALAAADLATTGRIVVSIDYRLAPEHPFPQGLFDAFEAYRWLAENPSIHGGSLREVSLIGESAGSNFALAIALAVSGMVPEKDLIGLPPLPGPDRIRATKAVLHCGILQVSHVARFRKDARAFSIARVRVKQVQTQYLPECRSDDGGEWGLADPLTYLETRTQSLPTTFPDCFVPVGAKDPIIGDSERLAALLERSGQPDRLRVYPGVGHAFHVFPFGEQARLCWEDIVAFLENRGIGRK